MWPIYFLTDGTIVLDARKQVLPTDVTDAVGGKERWRLYQAEFQLWKNPAHQVTYLDCAALAEDDSHTIHIDDHSPDVGDPLVTSSVLVLGVHSEVRQVGGNVAGFGQGVGAGSHVMVGEFVKCDVVRISRHWADTKS